MGLGPVDTPYLWWDVSSPILALDSATIASLESRYSGADFWVRQIGSFAQSDPLLLTSLP